MHSPTLLVAMRLLIPALTIGCLLAVATGLAVQRGAQARAQVLRPLGPNEFPIVDPRSLAATRACPDDMVEVEGDYCTDLETTCIRQRPHERGCDEYARPTVCKGDAVHMHYCIDTYEFPNKAGEKPLYNQNWYDAVDQCRRVGKRVCDDPEWTLACEGPERLPYPYGYVRDRNACTIDIPSPRINEDRFYSADRDKELARLDRRDPSGARAGCVSAFGVHDMTGNVDEWTTNPSQKPDKGALKGGNWGEWRNACRPSTLGHAAWFRYYQTGFRCCADTARAR